MKTIFSAKQFRLICCLAKTKYNKQASPLFRNLVVYFTIVSTSRGRMRNGNDWFFRVEDQYRTDIKVFNWNSEVSERCLLTLLHRDSKKHVCSFVRVYVTVTGTDWIDFNELLHTCFWTKHFQYSKNSMYELTYYFRKLLNQMKTDTILPFLIYLYL